MSTPRAAVKGQHHVSITRDEHDNLLHLRCDTCFYQMRTNSRERADALAAMHTEMSNERAGRFTAPENRQELLFRRKLRHHPDAHIARMNRR